TPASPGLGLATPAASHVQASGTSVPAPVTISVTGLPATQPGCTPYAIGWYPLYTQDARYQGYELPDVALCNQADAAIAAATLSWIGDASAPSGGIAIIRGTVTNLTAA